jgi:hypothetical protein
MPWDHVPTLAHLHFGVAPTLSHCQFEALGTGQAGQFP